MKAFITGSRGFVGRYLISALVDRGYQVVGVDVIPGPGVDIVADILDATKLEDILADNMPDIIFHLAGQASVSSSWKIPQKTMEINVIGTLNLLEAVLKSCPKSRVVLIGSSDEYGRLMERGQLVDEEQPLMPQTPYAVSKQAQEELAKLYVSSKGMNIYMTRSFNHSGAGQPTGFIIPDFASGIVAIERGLVSELTVGNLESSRDFTHVRDIVEAYILIAEYGVAGEVYNVGSGNTYKIRDILQRMIGMSTSQIEVVQDRSKLRPSDTPMIRCDNRKLREQTGWSPQYSLDLILEDVLNYFRKNTYESHSL